MIRTIVPLLHSWLSFQDHQPRRRPPRRPPRPSPPLPPRQPPRNPAPELRRRYGTSPSPGVSDPSSTPLQATIGRLDDPQGHPLACANRLQVRTVTRPARQHQQQREHHGSSPTRRPVVHRRQQGAQPATPARIHQKSPRVLPPSPISKGVQDQGRSPTILSTEVSPPIRRQSSRPAPATASNSLCRRERASTAGPPTVHPGQGKSHPSNNI